MNPHDPAFPPGCELVLVIPVYNEQANLRKVLLDWYAELENWTDDFALLVIDDGSTDRTPEILELMRKRLGERLVCLRKENSGHGQSCLLGYRKAAAASVPYVMQVDSDGQCHPEYFFRFWRLRGTHAAVYGHRTRRDDGLRRVAASLVLKLLLLFFFRSYCVDANVPYRLYQTDKIRPLLDRLPSDFDLANVGLAYLGRKAGLKEASVPIRFRERYGGEPKVKLARFGTKALELCRALRRLG
jgi:dolichol-phosphate mannosyltransferase